MKSFVIKIVNNNYFNRNYTKKSSWKILLEVVELTNYIINIIIIICKVTLVVRKKSISRRNRFASGHIKKIDKIVRQITQWDI